MIRIVFSAAKIACPCKIINCLELYKPIRYNGLCTKEYCDAYARQAMDGIIVDYIKTTIYRSLLDEYVILNPILTETGLKSIIWWLNLRNMIIDRVVWVDNGDDHILCKPTMYMLRNVLQRVESYSLSKCQYYQPVIDKSANHLMYITNPEELKRALEYLIILSVSIQNPMDTTLIKYSPIKTDLRYICESVTGIHGLIFEYFYNDKKCIGFLDVKNGTVSRVDVRDESVFQIFDTFPNYPIGYFGRISNSTFCISGSTVSPKLFGFESYLHDLLKMKQNEFGMLYGNEKLGFRVFVPHPFNELVKNTLTEWKSNMKLPIIKDNITFEWKSFYETPPPPQPM
jgi:hypothetical protein